MERISKNSAISIQKFGRFKHVASVLIPKLIHYFCTLFPFCCDKTLNRSPAMLANFALLKEKLEAKISRPIKNHLTGGNISEMNY